MSAYPIVHFEIPTDDLQRAKAFYAKTFGWKIDEWKSPAGWEYFAVHTKNEKSEGIDGGLMKRKNPQQSVINYVTVPSIDGMLKTVIKNGGNVCLDKMEIAPGMGWVAVFQDTEGNQMGLHEAPPKSVPKTAKKSASKSSKKLVKKSKKK